MTRTACQKKESRAMQHLQAVDPILGAVIEKSKLSKVKPRANYFQSLVEEIISQQLSGRVADVITERFIGLFDNALFPTPDSILARSATSASKTPCSAYTVSASIPVKKRPSVSRKSGTLTEPWHAAICG